MAGIWNIEDDEPVGLLAGLQRGIGNPMTLAGLGLLTGGGWDAARQGMQMGAGFDEMRRADARRKQQAQALQGLLGDASITPQQRGLLQAAGPEAAFPLMLQRAFPDPPKPTDDEREYATARSQGFGGSFMDFLKDVKSFGAARTNIDMKQETAYDKTMGEELAKEFVTAQRTAGTAQRDIATLNTMRQALDDPNLYTGTGGNIVQSIKKGAETLFGVPVKGTSSGEIMQSIGAELALSNKDKLPGPMSNADREFLMQLPAGITKSPEGNRLLIGLALADKQWQIDRALAARSYAARNGGRLDAGYYGTVSEIDQKFARESAGIVAKLRGMGEMAPRSPTVGVPSQYKQKYGLE